MAALGVISSCAPRSQSSSQPSSISSSSTASSSVISSSVSSSIVVEEKKFSLTELKDFVREEYYNEKSLWYYNHWDKKIANKILPEFLMSVDKFVFIPPVPEKGFNIPYVIKFPSGNYANTNIGLKKHILLGNYGSQADPEYGFALFQYINQNVYDDRPLYESDDNIPMLTSDRLDVPMLTPIVTWNCAESDFDQTLNTNLDRDSVLATEKNMSNYLKMYCGNSQTPLRTPFEKYEYPSIIDLEKQFYHIIRHSTQLLNNFNYKVEHKVFMTGFSSTGNFTQRFSTIYPEVIKAYFAGGISAPILPGSTFNDKKLLYPVGTSEHALLFDKEFNLEDYNNIAKINFIGKYENKFTYIDRYLKDIVASLIFKDINFDFWDYSRESTMQMYWDNIADIFYSLEGSGMFMFNTETAHYVSENDFNFSIEFFKMNANSDTPVYPKSSPYPEHIIRLS
jgi:hypothetical protein